MAEKGSYINNKYEIKELIGQGGMSKVYLAYDTKLGKNWALKEIKRHGEDKNGIYEASALIEANILKKLDHPALPRIVDIIENNEYLYVIMDYIEGENLEDILREKKRIPQEIVLKWAGELCSVLKYLHGRHPPIIYRDMKPGNIIVLSTGRIKLIDFGIAREFKNDNTSDTICLGTRGYAAPEQFGGHGQTDGRTDIYNLGATLYHLLTGHNPCDPPYKLYPIRHWDSMLSPGLENIILKCTQTNPEDRYRNIEELQYALDNYEKEDTEYKRKSRIKLILYEITVVLSSVFFCLGALFYAAGCDITEKRYYDLINKGEKSVNEEDKIRYVISAIELVPGKNEAYYSLIGIFKEDGIFTEEEEKCWNKVVDEYIDSLKDDSEYSALAYEVGKLYWYYYSYGGSNIAGIKSSVPWFEDAAVDLKWQDSATIYYLIGCFHRDITVKVSECEEEGIYFEYFQNLNYLLLLSESNSSVVERLEAVSLVIYSIDVYRYDFIDDGISLSEIEKMREKAISILYATNATSDQNRERKNDIEEYIDETED